MTIAGTVPIIDPRTFLVNLQDHPPDMFAFWFVELKPWVLTDFGESGFQNNSGPNLNVNQTWYPGMHSCFTLFFFAWSRLLSNMSFWSVSSCLPLLLVESLNPVVCVVKSFCWLADSSIWLAWISHVLLSLLKSDVFLMKQTSFLRETKVVGELIILSSVWEWGIPPKG